MAAKLTSKATFRRMVDTILSASTADDTFISFGDAESSTLRFANNQVVQNVSVRGPRISVQAAFGRKVGRTSTNRLDTDSLIEAVRRAERIARLAPPDPEYLPPLQKQKYLKVPGYRRATTSASPMELANRTRPVIETCAREGLTGAGIMSCSTSVRGVAASSGLFGYEPSTEARFSLTATGADSSGWTLNAHRDINALNLLRRTDRAVDKALRSKDPREIPAGHYPVILEPAAVAGIVGPILWGLGAKAYYRGNSPFVGKLGSVVLDPRLSIVSDPTHEDLLGARFGGNGLATRRLAWIRNGVLKELHYDRFTAKEHSVEPTPWPGAVVMHFKGPTVDTTGELIAQAKRAILVTNFWYIRSVDRTDLTVTGMTRDGTFLVEDGRIVSGLRNFRFHDSPLRCLAQVDAATEPQESITLERGKMLLPAFSLPDFHLSSVTKF